MKFPDTTVPFPEFNQSLIFVAFEITAEIQADCMSILITFFKRCN